MARRLIKAIFPKETSEDYQVLEGSGTNTLNITNMTLSTQSPQYRLRNPVPALVSSWTPLHTAALGPGLTRLAPGIFLQNTSNVKLMRDIRQLLENPETNVNAKNASGETPLHVACRTNYSKAVAKLINVPDIDVNARDNSGKTPVMASAKYGKEKALRLMLLDPRVELDFRSIEGKGLEDLVEDFSRGRECLDWIPCSQMIKQVREKRSRWHKQQKCDKNSYNKRVSERDVEEIKDGWRIRYIEEIEKIRRVIEEREKGLKGKLDNIEKSDFYKRKIEEDNKSKLDGLLDGITLMLTEMGQTKKENCEEMRKFHELIQNLICIIDEHKDIVMEAKVDEKKEDLQYFTSLNELTIMLTKDLPQQDIETKNEPSTRDYHHLEDERKTLECPICLELMKPPTKIWMCQSTHLICEECKDQLVGGRCPTCRVENVPLRDFMAENLADSLF